jgi:hypothetical protein
MSLVKIAGIETEYGISGGQPGDPQRWSSEIVQAYGRWAAHARGRPGVGEATDWMLPNGARLYVDHGHPEYSTPECTSPETLVAADKAGESLLVALSETVRQDKHAVHIYKNNHDGHGNTYGCHENYLIAAPQFTAWMENKAARLIRELVPFLVTRPIFCGAGRVCLPSDSSPASYQLWQRADTIESLVGEQTMASRPLINTRDEPLADPARFRRLHIIVGDANMSEWATYLKIATTQLVLAMLEDNQPLSDVALADPLAAVRLVSRDVSLCKPLPLESGKKATALDIQWTYLNAAEHYIAQVESEANCKKVVREWKRVLDTLAADPKHLDDEIDWLIKQTLLEELTGGTDGPRAREIDIKYHDLDPERGIFNILRGQGLVRGFLSEDVIEHLVVEPPDETRAFARGRLIALYGEHISQAAWAHLSSGDGTIRFPDPRQSSQAKIAGLPSPDHDWGSLVERWEAMGND